MEIIKLIALLLGTAILFISCSATSPAPTLSYQDSSFRAHISWSVNGVTLSAFLTSIAEVSPSGTGKTVTLEIISPSSLAGVSICKKNGVLQTRLGDMQIASEHAERLFTISSLFEIDATVTKSSVCEMDGRKFNLIEAASSSGQKYSLFLFPESELPRRIISEIAGKTCVLDSLSFEFIDQT